MGLGRTRYGIHGSDMPWSVGRAVTRGFIRMYPEHIKLLFNQVEIGTPVKIIYKPVKIAICGRRIFYRL